MDDTPELPFGNPDSASQQWLTRVTKHERAHWEAKSQSQKEWWYENTEPADRGELLRSEIAIMASHNELLHLPEATRNAIIKRWKDEADEAAIKIRQFLSKSPHEGK